MQIYEENETLKKEIWRKKLEIRKFENLTKVPLCQLFLKTFQTCYYVRLKIHTPLKSDVICGFNLNRMKTRPLFFLVIKEPVKFSQMFSNGMKIIRYS